jgi:hypothetical protein
VVFIVQDIHQVGIERVDVIENWEFGQDLTELIMERLLRVSSKEL